MFPYPSLQGSSHYCSIPNCFQGFCSLFEACRGTSSKPQCVVVETPYTVCSQRTCDEQHLLGKQIAEQDKGLRLWFPVRPLSQRTPLRYDCDAKTIWYIHTIWALHTRGGPLSWIVTETIFKYRWNKAYLSFRSTTLGLISALNYLSCT